VDADAKLWPWIQGKNMPFKICGYMNMVGYMEKKKSPSTSRVYRQITFEETEDFYAKDQYIAFEKNRMIDPTLPKLVAAVKAAKGSTAAPAARRTTVKKKGAMA